MNQPTEPTETSSPMNQQCSSNAAWYVVGAIVVLAAVAAFWYYRTQAPVTGTQPSAVEQTQIPSLSGGNTTADISADLTRTADNSAALDAATAAVVQAVEGF